MTGGELRALLLSLPEAEERETWGHPTFRVREKMFAGMSVDGRSAGLKSTLDVQAALIAAAPDVFSVPAYVGRYGWVDVVVERADADELRELAIEAWRRTAPKRVVAMYDAEHAAVWGRARQVEHLHRPGGAGSAAIGDPGLVEGGHAGEDPDGRAQHG